MPSPDQESESEREARIAEESLSRALVKGRRLRLAGLAFAGDPEYLCREMQQAVIDDRVARGLDVDHGDGAS